ncbi:MAG: hypothetical protein GEU75_07515 [Dehalococcoidia bacterium]|nr:hypothetical protein [Dehalococcoidia bacterium]
MDIPIYLETGTRRVFACSVEWPGWCRSARDESSAIEALADYLPRYARVAEKAGIPFGDGTAQFEVIERVKGSGTTDFGAPGSIPDVDRLPLDPPTRIRLGRLLRAAWDCLDAAVGAAPVVLPKGPRGGGRDRDEIVRHVLEAETSYARTIGVRASVPDAGAASVIAEHRDAIASAIENPEHEGRSWPIAYACRRIAWHVLDHAWELEDKSAT